MPDLIIRADESVVFYLILQLPTTDLNRSQLSSLLLPSSHLTLSAELSYVQSPTMMSSTTGLNGMAEGKGKEIIGLGRPPLARANTDTRASLFEGQGPVAPLTPKPTPGTRGGDRAYGDVEGLVFWSSLFAPPVRGLLSVDASSNSENGKGKEPERGGRVWIGWNKEQSKWMAVWEFVGQVGELSISLTTVTHCHAVHS